MGKILSVSLDTSLLFTREMVLRRTGAEVWSAKIEPAVTLMQSEFFDVVLLCHTLPDEDVLHITKLLELFWPNSRVLLVGERSSIEAPGAGVSLEAGPVTLVEKTVKLLAHTRERHFGAATIVPFHGGTHLVSAKPARKV